jgi:hypothetical protein
LFVEHFENGHFERLDDYWCIGFLPVSFQQRVDSYGADVFAKRIGFQHMFGEMRAGSAMGDNDWRLTTECVPGKYG